MSDKMRPFRNKGDVKRMMQRLFGTKSKDAEALDPTTMMAMLAKTDGFPGAFSVYETLANVGIPFTWGWWDNPADSLREEPVLTAQPHFWNPGQDIAPKSQFFRYVLKDEVLSGWYFTPDTITVRFFTSGDVAKSALIALIRNWTVYNRRGISGVNADFASIMAQNISSANVQIQHFGKSPVTAIGTGSTVHALYCVTLIPGYAIAFDNFTGLVNGDKVAIEMCGKWRFSPRFITRSEERDG